MKIATSSASFARAIAAGELTQLEWLDACANELEVDGVVFDAAQFPRLDAEYLAQLKKMAVDLGLTVAAVATDDAFGASGDAWLAAAVALGAPLLVLPAPATSDDATAWGAFTEALKALAGRAKHANVTLALRNEAGTLCESLSDVRRLFKDIDSAWLRCALETSALTVTDVAELLLPKTVIARHVIGDVPQFATPGDAHAVALVERLQRFRGFVMLEPGDVAAPREAYHAAVERFTLLRATQLAKTP